MSKVLPPELIIALINYYTIIQQQISYTANLQSTLKASLHCPMITIPNVFLQYSLY